MDLEIPVEDNKKNIEEKQISLEEKALPIFVNDFDSHYSIWNRIKKLYIPDETEKDIGYKEQLFHKLCHSSEKPEIEDEKLFYSNLIANSNITSNSLFTSFQERILDNKRNQEVPLFDTPQKEIDFLNDAIRQIKQSTFEKISSDKDSLKLSNSSNNPIECKLIKQKPIEPVKPLESIKSIRISNLCDQIYAYQMRILANSISLIQKSQSSGLYYVSFDPCLMIPKQELRPSDYEELIKYREPLNRKALYPNKSIIDTNDQSSDEITILNYDLIEYHFCHQCKLRKVDGKHCSNKKFPGEYIALPINNLYLLINEKHIYAIDYNKNASFVEVIFEYIGQKKRVEPTKEPTEKCNRFLCLDCFKELLPNQGFDSKAEFTCFKCSKSCHCISCRCEFELSKLVACYLHLQWDMGYLYDYCIKRYPLLEEYKEQLMLSRFVLCLVNEEMKKDAKKDKDKEKEKDKDKKKDKDYPNIISIEDAEKYRSNIMKCKKESEDHFLFYNQLAIQLINGKNALQEEMKRNGEKSQ